MKKLLTSVLSFTMCCGLTMYHGESVFASSMEDVYKTSLPISLKLRGVNTAETVRFFIWYNHFMVTELNTYNYDAGIDIDTTMLERGYYELTFKMNDLFPDDEFDYENVYLCDRLTETAITNSHWVKEGDTLKLMFEVETPTDKLVISGRGDYIKIHTPSRIHRSVFELSLNRL